MRPIATDVARSVVCVYVLGTHVSCAKKAEPIEMPFGELTHVDPRNNVLDGCQDRANPFGAARGDKTAIT